MDKVHIYKCSSCDFKTEAFGDERELKSGQFPCLNCEGRLSVVCYKHCDSYPVTQCRCIDRITQPFTKEVLCVRCKSVRYEHQVWDNFVSNEPKSVAKKWANCSKCDKEAEGVGKGWTGTGADICKECSRVGETDTVATFDQVKSYIAMLDSMEQTEEVVEAKKKALKAMDRFLFPKIKIVFPELLIDTKKKRWFR